jgi:hypothetical protein
MKKNCASGWLFTRISPLTFMHEIEFCEHTKRYCLELLLLGEMHKVRLCLCEVCSYLSCTDKNFRLLGYAIICICPFIKALKFRRSLQEPFLGWSKITLLTWK